MEVKVNTVVLVLVARPPVYIGRGTGRENRYLTAHCTLLSGPSYLALTQTEDDI